MADWKRKAQRALKDELRPGEDVVAAAFLQPSETAIGAHVMAVESDCPGLAATLPDSATVLALTTQRLLAMGHSALTGRPKGVVSTLAPNDVVRVDLEESSAGSLVVIQLADGTTRTYEAIRLNDDIGNFADRINNR